MKEIITTVNAPNRGRPLSQAVKHGNLVFISGQVGVNPENGDILEGFKAQTRQTIENLLSILNAAGGTIDNIVKVTVFLKDIKDFEVFNVIYREYFKSNFPARSAFQVAGLASSFEVEIEAIAILD